MLYWKISIIVLSEIRELVKELHAEKSKDDDDTPYVLTKDEIAHVISKRFIGVVPKIVQLVKP